MRTLPSGRVDSDEPALDTIPGFNGSAGVWYMNAVMGRTPAGRLAILMPTEAQEPAQLTANDLRARGADQRGARRTDHRSRRAQRAHGPGPFDDGTRLHRDWGMHCLSNVLPLMVTPR